MHENQVPWDAAILAKMGTSPFKEMPQNGTADEQMAALMNAEMVQPVGKIDVRIADIESYLGMQGRLARLEQFSTMIISAADPPTGNDLALVAAKELMRFFNNQRLSVFQTSNPATYQSFAAFVEHLVANGNISEQNGADILALAPASGKKKK